MGILILAGPAAGQTSFPWTPAFLDVLPLAWIHAPNAVWSGSNLSSLPGFIVNATPTKGTTQNSISPIRFDDDAEGLTKTSALTSGSAYYFVIGARLNTTDSDQPLIQRDWTATTGFFASIATNLAVQQGSGMGGAGYNGFINDTGQAPWFEYGTSNAIADTAWHSQQGYLSAGGNALFKDGVSLTLARSIAGAVPSFGGGTFSYFGPFSGGARYDCGALLLLDYVPTTDERQRIEGYYHWLYGVQSLLDAGHPYKAAAPTTGPKTSSAVGSAAGTGVARLAPVAPFMMGVNISAGEFGDRNSVYGTGYIYPTTGELDYFDSKGMTIIRLPFLWERMQPTLGAALNSAEVSRVQTVLNNAAARGMTLILEPHNYGRYDLQVIGSGSVSVANFANFWSRMATEYGGDPGLASFGLMNEPHDMGAVPWATSAQAAIDAIRAAGSTDLIFVPGDGWQAADVWAATNPSFPLTDPENKLIYEAHKYFDANHTGGYTAGGYDAEGAYPNVGVDRIQPFINWLAANNQIGFMGEFNVPGNDARWLVVLENVVDLLHANGVSGTAWAAGPWWGSYSQSLEPAGGVDKPQIAVLTKYA